MPTWSEVSAAAQGWPPRFLHPFRVDVTELVLTTVAGDLLVVERWDPACGQPRTERR